MLLSKTMSSEALEKLLSARAYTFLTLYVPRIIHFGVKNELAVGKFLDRALGVALAVKQREMQRLSFPRQSKMQRR